jgi:hypothetical protein
MIKYSLAIFDLDGTIFYETIFDDVFEILHQFKLNNIKMAIASYNPYAEFFCNRYDITKYFDIICGYTKNNKISHINEIKSYYKNKGTIFTDNEIIFFDDDMNNINDIKNNTNITCIPINPEKGITKDMIKLVI